MPLNQIARLEKHVSELLGLVRRLKEDNNGLEKRVKTCSQQLAKRERDTHRWNQDRDRVRVKVEKILSEVGVFSSQSTIFRREGARPRKRGDA